MFFRSADTRYLSTGPAQWQESFLNGPDPGTSFPLGFEGPPAPHDDVPVPRYPATGVILTDQILPALSPPPALKTYLADGAPWLPLPAPKTRPIDGWQFDPLPVLSHSALDQQPPPSSRPAPNRQPADAWTLPPLVTGLAERLDDPLPARPAAISARQPPPAELTPPALLPPYQSDPLVLPARAAPGRPPLYEWTAAPLVSLAPWFDASPGRSTQPRGRPQFEPWGFDPMQSLATALFDPPPIFRTPAPARRPPEDLPLPLEGRAPAFDVLIIPVPVPARRLNDLGWMAPPLGAIASAAFDTAPIRYYKPGRLLVPTDPALTPMSAVILAPWFQASELRPLPPKRQPVFDPWVLDPLPALRAAPLDLGLITPPIIKLQRPPAEQIVPALNLALAHLETAIPPRPRALAAVRPAAEQILAALRLVLAQPDPLLLPPRPIGARQPPALEQLDALARAALFDPFVVMPRAAAAARIYGEDLGRLLGRAALEDPAIVRQVLLARRPPPEEPLPPRSTAGLPPALPDELFRPRPVRGPGLPDGAILLLLVPPLPPLKDWAFAFPGYSLRDAIPVGDSATIAVLIPFGVAVKDVDD